MTATRYALIAIATLTLLAIASPAVLAAGPDKPLAPDAHTRLLVHFDNADDVANPAYIRAGHGNLGGRAGQDYSFVQGRFGQALALKAAGQVEFPCTGGNFPSDVGSAEMWLAPTQAFKGWETPFMRGGSAWDEWGQNMVDVHVDQVDGGAGAGHGHQRPGRVAVGQGQVRRLAGQPVAARTRCAGTCPRAAPRSTSTASSPERPPASRSSWPMASAASASMAGWATTDCPQ